MAHFTLYSHAKGANGWSVAFVLKALGLSYETKYLDFGDFTNGEHKREPYTRINPNGRIPALIDHQNGDFTVWESKACMLYLVSKCAFRSLHRRDARRALFLHSPMSGADAHYKQTTRRTSSGSPTQPRSRLPSPSGSSSRRARSSPLRSTSR